MSLLAELLRIAPNAIKCHSPMDVSDDLQQQVFKINFKKQKYDMNTILKEVAEGKSSTRSKVHVHLKISPYVGRATVISRQKPTISNF
jgi:hypothetical protein